MPAASSKRLFLIGTMDTKGALIRRVADMARKRNARVTIVDASLKGTVARSGKSEAMRRAADRVAEQLAKAKGDAGFLALGGGTGSWIAMRALAKLPLGPPKAVVTTLAFDPRALVAGTDIVVVPCPVDLQGNNEYIDAALQAGLAAALAGTLPVSKRASPAPLVAITALGVVQDCVAKVQDSLEENGVGTCVFHAAGSNGRTLCDWIERGERIRGVIDLAPNDLHALFGNLAGDAERMNRLAAAKSGVPYLFVPGGLDFLTRSTGGLTATEKRRGRYEHSPEFTHVRTTRVQVARAAGFVARQLRGKKTNARLLIPDRGWSMANSNKGTLASRSADEAFYRTLMSEGMDAGRVFVLPHHINDGAFAKSCAQHMLAMLGLR